MAPRPALHSRSRCAHVARALLALVLGLFAAIPDAAAYTYRMMRDDTLLQQSPVVFAGRITRRMPAGANADGLVLDTLYEVAVLRVLKGAVSPTVMLKLPGASNDVAGLRVAGIPQYEAGVSLIVFAQPMHDGTYRPVQLMLGLFREVVALGDSFYVRDLHRGVSLDRAMHSEYARPRHGARFIAWLTAASRGDIRPADYLVDPSPEDRGKFTPLTIPYNGVETPTRWQKFDQGLTEPWFATSSGQAGMLTDEFAQVQQALAAWTNDATSNIRLAYGGVVVSDSGNGTATQSRDNRSAVIWNDPDNDIPGAYDCKGGGTLAFGGPFVQNLHTHATRTHWTIVEGFVVVQDGAGCDFDGNGGADGAETLAHEIGHALGFGHSCGDSESPPCNSNPVLDDALMRAYIHGDGRGASLRADDIAGALYLYPAGSPTTPIGTRPDPIFANGFE